IASDASALYAKNLLKFVEELYDREKKELAVKTENEVVAGTLVTRGGAVVHPKLSGK
ncbi:MAG: NAD(P)(+) transhydrogenase (Re/Si-specific) subunit alpha, partial [Elusimicrobia bacterium]|nr:NAD(P)(+) transhydrogenase (Re/Si-specific) subunit alpha [Elusimicrobiota bacterium]